MFRWYKNAATCYVYLSDVTYHDSKDEIVSSRWFTRGWTLQELIAPKDVRFYSATWQVIGTKATMCDQLFTITNIDTYVLAGGDLETASAARKMSWASRRKTSRVEDIAYCLLGIFDVNMPLIYGEGRRAFQRLQEAIILKTHDQSLFAWGSLVDIPSGMINRDQDYGLEPVPWASPTERHPLLGLFANGPELFKSSGDIAPTHSFSHELRRNSPPALISGGVLLGLVIAREELSAMHFDRPVLAIPTRIEIAVLLCRIGSTGGKLIGLILRQWGEGYHGRTPELVVLNMTPSAGRFRNMVRQRHIMRELPPKLCSGDVIFRRFITSLDGEGVKRQSTQSGPAWLWTCWGECTIFRLASDALGDESFRFNFRMSPHQGVAVSMRRVKAAGLVGNLMVEIFPITFRPPVTDEAQFYTTIAEAVQNQPPGKVGGYVMQTPCDSCAFGTGGDPRVHIRVERLELDPGDGTVDVVDIFLSREGPEADLAKRAIEAMNARQGG